MKKIAIVSYYYPPFSLIGAKRITYLTRYLQKNDVQTIVIKADNIYYGENIDTALEDTKSSIIDVNIDDQRSILPERVKWYYAFKEQLDALLTKQKVDCVYFTGGPFFYFSLGEYIKKKYGVPYVLDFRDPWYVGHHNKNKKYNLIYKILENKAVTSADLIINVTESAAKLQKQYYSSVSKEKFKVIHNGYDDAILSTIDLSSNKKMLEEGTFNIGIWGKFGYYNTHHVDIVLDGISKLKNEMNIKLYHIGEKEEYFMNQVRSKELDPYVCFLGHMNYKEGIELLNGMDCLLLNHRSPYMVGTKIYDYIYLNKPIVAFAKKEDEISKLLNNFQNSFTIENKEEFISSLKTIDTDHLEVLDINFNKHQYSREYQMQKLFGYLMQMLDRK